MAGKSNGVDSGDWARAPPKKGPLCVRILKAIYDPDDNTFLGRTPRRWGILVIFYLVFYTVLVLLFAACMGGLFAYIEIDKPTFILEQSLIGVNPGVAFRPRPVDGVTVRYKNDNVSSYMTYVQEMNDFLQPYLGDESWSTSKQECTEEDNFGFPESPCFFIKLNKIYGWEPVFLTNDFPPEMPSDLTDHIKTLQDPDPQQIWISCWEENPNNSTLEYPWGRGLPRRFYPFYSQVNYLSPLIAVKITPPRNTEVAIRCRAWAKNIIYNKSLKEPSGYTRIVIYVEDAEVKEANTQQ